MNHRDLFVGIAVLAVLVLASLFLFAQEAEATNFARESCSPLSQTECQGSQIRTCTGETPNTYWGPWTDCLSSQRCSCNGVGCYCVPKNNACMAEQVQDGGL